MNQKIKIPERVEDFTEKHRQFIWTEILGGKIDGEFTTWYENENLYADKKWILNDCKCGSDWFHPERKIECAKMLDGWLIEKGLILKIDFECHHFSKPKYEVYIYNENADLLGEKFSNSEPFARTCAILKAYIEIEEE